MLKNGWSDASVERAATLSLSNSEESERTSLSTSLRSSFDKSLQSAAVCNRDSGVFDDFVSPTANLQDNNLVLPDNDQSSLDTQSPSIDPESEDEDSCSSYDSDREHHASLSSLDSAGDTASLSISLSSLSSSSSKDDDCELSASSDSEFDDDLSGKSSRENDSRSFGYHSLLNNLTLDEDSESVVGYEPGFVLPHCDSACDESHDHTLNSISQVITREASGDSCPLEEGVASCSTSPSNASYFESSEEENPSDIENKMAETKVKMGDAILSSGREELCGRKLKLMKKHKEGLMEAMNCNQIRNDLTFKTSNNKINNNNNKSQLNRDKQQLYEETAWEKLNLPLGEDCSSWADNRFSSSEDSPVVDAYEKECRDVPEKMTRELEKENREKISPKETQETLSQMDLEHDRDLQAFEAVMKAAIKNKEAGYQSTSHIPMDFSDDLSMRHRPSPQQRRRERNAMRRAIPHPNGGSRGDKNKLASPDVGEFDVYTMETTLPTIDWEAIEAHLNATKEEEKRRRTDREEIRRKLAMGTDDDLRNDQQMKKPSLHSRLQNGKNLQICFMNETASDCESQCSDTESTQDRIDEVEGIQKEGKLDEHSSKDFPSYQAKLQEEARLALSQAKEMARMEMQLQKQNRVKSPITEIVRGSFSKVGFPFPETKRRMSRQILTDMNVAQLQVIVNEFHTQIENLNEVLVELLLKRDDLHMEQDSMLVDIEDLTKHLGAKEQFKFLKSEGKGVPVNNKNKNSFVVSSSFSKTSKLKAFVKK